MFVVFVFVRIERAGVNIYSKQKRHWLWRVLRKRVTASGAFGEDATDSGAFLFIYLKLSVSHSYF
jgi:hypothetical protein